MSSPEVVPEQRTEVDQLAHYWAICVVLLGLGVTPRLVGNAAGQSIEVKTEAGDRLFWTDLSHPTWSYTQITVEGIPLVVITDVKITASPEDVARLIFTEEC